jgi:putative phage-type endonuclease
MPVLALSKAKWLENRRKFLGASDAAPVMGRSQYRSKVDVYLEKVEGKADEETDYMRRGMELEPLVIYLYQQATGHKTIPSKFLVSKKHPWMAATLDLGDATLACPVQCKTASTYTRDKYGDPARDDYTLPADYMIQMHHEMIVSETKANQLAVLFAPEDGFDALRAMMRVKLDMQIIAAETLKRYEFVIFPVALDKKLAADIIKTEKAFWEDHIQAKVPPICDALPQKTDIIREPTKKELVILAKAEKAYRGWKLAEGRWLDHKQGLKDAIGENSGIAIPTGGKVTWKAPAPKTEVVEVTDYEAIAKDLYITKQIPDTEWKKLIEENTTKTTTTKQGPRVLRVPSKDWAAS